MFGSTILDLAMGLIFTFLMISLVTSAVTETISSAAGWRANTLLAGVKELLNETTFTGLVKEIYNHAAVNPRSNGAAQNEAELGTKPSYIDPKQFASALIDVTKLPAGANVADVQAQINAAVPNAQLRTLLDGIVTRAGGNINLIRDDIAAWFDNGMQRVAGVYKRKTQLWGFIIAVVLAISLNVDTVRVAHTLWQRPLTESPQLSSIPKAQDAIVQAEQLGIPLGWDDETRGIFASGLNWGWAYAIVGWFISAVATLFGAPFWFDALQKFVQLRGAGSK